MKLLSSSSRSALVALLTVTLSPSHVLGGGPAPTTTPSPALGGVATPTEVPSLVYKLSACALTPNCLTAANAWNDCSSNYRESNIKILHASPPNKFPSEPVRSCLCEVNASVPSHPEWSHSLTDCAACFDTAITLNGTFSGVSGSLFVLAGTPISFQGFCRGQFSYEEFVTKAKELQRSSNFPLRLPEAVLEAAGTQSMVTAAPTHTNVGLFSLTQPGSSPHTRFIVISSCTDCPSLTQPGPSFHTIHTDSKGPIASVTPIVSLTSKATFTIISTPASTPLQCDEDNCFRQLIRSSALAAPFCNTYIPTPSTCTTGLPTYVSQCSSIPARISSACSCLTAKQTDLLSSSTRNNLTQGRFSATFSESVVQVTESESVSIVTATGSGLASLTQSGSPKYTASLSTLTEDVSMVPRPLSHPTQTSSFTYGPSGVGSLTQPGSSFHSTRVAAAPTSSQTIATWASFPPTDAMKSCLTIDACKRAACAFRRCMDDRYDDTTSWNCFCETNFQTWRDVAGKCSSCITDALPASTTYNISDVILAENFVLDKFCNVTDTNVKAKSRSALVKMGNSLTTYFESPIAFYNFTLLDAPIGDPLQSTVLTLASASMTAKLGQPTQTVFSEVWITSTLPRSTSPPTPTPTKWASIPISPALRACQEGSSCYNAGAVFKDCIGKGTASNNTATWHCLCHTKLIFWDAALDSCLFCIASSLLPQNSTHAPWAPKRMLDVKRVLINENYCKADQSAAGINRTTPWLIDAGFDATVIFQSPVLLWNMTVLKDGLGVDQRVLDPIISAVNVGVASSALQVGKSTATAVATPAAAEF